jgi:hypothetical protein
MTRRSKIFAVALVGGISLFDAMRARAQDAPPLSDKPFQERWAPTEFGANDKAGAVNRTTPQMVLKAIRLVKQGKVATLGKYYASDIPTFGARSWTMIIPGTPTGGPVAKNAVVYHDEFVATEIGQIGTQFDGPGHIGVHTSKGNFFYNGRMAEKTYQRGQGGRVMGMGDLGVEHVAEKGFTCRGVLARCGRLQRDQPVADPEGPEEPGHRHRRRRPGYSQEAGPRGHRRGGLRVPLYRARRPLVERGVEDALPRGQSEATGAVPVGRTGVRDQRLRVLRAAEDHPDRWRHLFQ